MRGTLNRRTWLAAVGASLLVTKLRDARSRDRDTGPPLSVAVRFRWNSEVVANPLARKQGASRHILANDSVDALAVAGTVDGQRIVLRGESTPQQRFYDPDRNLYMTNPLPSSEVQRLVERGAGGTYTLDLRFSLFTFFDVMLGYMTRTGEDMHNLAHPNDSAAVLGTIVHAMRDGKPSISYQAETHTIRGLPCTLIDVDVKSPNDSLAPAIELLFEIDFTTALDARRRGAMRKLAAMDWSALARLDATTATPLPAHAEVWRDNLLLFLANQTDMHRAERFRTSIASRHATKRPGELAAGVRADIDLHLVTANRWGATREDIKRERYQALLSDILQTLHEHPASPIKMSRELTRRYGLSLDEQAAMTLQYGAGHCGEHGRVSFSILRTIMSIPGNQLDSIVLCGNANIDHAFVLCNLKVTRVILTAATSPTNQRVEIGEELKVFNLREALANTPRRESFVVDPYLDTSMTSRTGRRLLRALNSPRKQERGMETDFLTFGLQFPVPADFTIEDIRDRPFAERMKLIPNV